MTNPKLKMTAMQVDAHTPVASATAQSPTRSLERVTWAAFVQRRRHARLQRKQFHALIAAMV